MLEDKDEYKTTNKDDNEIDTKLSSIERHRGI